MRKIKFILLTVITFMAFSFLSARAANDGLPEFDTNSVIVITKPQRTYNSVKLFTADGAENMDNVLKNLGITETKELMSVSDTNTGISLFSSKGGGEKKILELALPEGGEDKVREAVDALNASGAVEAAEPNYYYYLDSVPNDTYYQYTDYNYHLTKVGAEKVWDMNIDCSGINVAVLDSGILSGHEDLIDNISTTIPGYDFAEGDNDPDDTYDASHAGDSGFVQGHGTHVSGIVSAVTNNGKGVASLAGGTQKKGAKIVHLKLFKDAVNPENGLKYKTTSTNAIVNAINYVNINNIPIANCSWGGTYSEATATAIKSCKNTLFVFSAGNNGKSNDVSSTKIYPASLGYDNIISVGVSTPNDTLASFSNYGNNVDLAAPGQLIQSTYNLNLSSTSYKQMSGTSQAAPLVVSCAAVMKGARPNLTPKEIKQAIIDNADVVSTLSYTSGSTKRTVNGNRRLNAYKALLSVTNISITWKNYDGSVLDASYVSYGEVPQYAGATPQKPSTEEYDYFFTGWSPEVNQATEDTVYTAVFDGVKRKYNVSWLNYDGSVLEKNEVEYSALPVYTGTVPSREDDTFYSYVFNGWDREIVPVTGEAEYRAVFDRQEKKDITFLPSLIDGIDIGKREEDGGDTVLYIGGENSVNMTFYAYFVSKNEDGIVTGIEREEINNLSIRVPKIDNCTMHIWTENLAPLMEPVNNLNTF